MLPSLADTWGMEPLESITLTNPHLIIAHTTHYGSVLMFYSLTSTRDPWSRSQVFRAAQALADLCAKIRGSRGLHRVQGSLILIVRKGIPRRMHDQRCSSPCVLAPDDECCSCVCFLSPRLRGQKVNLEDGNVLQLVNCSRGVSLRSNTLVSSLV